MTTNHRFIVVLSAAFFAVFTLMVLFGIHLTYRSLPDAARADTQLKINLSGEGAELELATAVPGVALITLGASGLISMLFKVPAKELVGYKPPSPVGANDDRNILLGTGALSTPEPVYSQRVFNIPAPVWWLVKSRGRFSRLN